jgi:polyhydroxyalkanoate synthesis repressor PhaR
MFATAIATLKQLWHPRARNDWALEQRHATLSRCNRILTVRQAMLNKTDQPVEKKEPVVIKKYANRRLYNTETSTYVTLDDLAAMVKSERDFVVFDAKSGDDLTHSVLTQIIVEQESRMGDQTLLPIPFLRQLIRFYGGSIERLVPSYLQISLDTLAREQERFRKQFATAFTPQGAFEAYQEQARKNLAIFEQAMAMFTPFGHGKQPGGKPDDAAKSTTEPVPMHTNPPGSKRDDPAKPTTEPTTSAESKPDELAELRNQLAAMQNKIDKLSKDRG